MQLIYQRVSLVGTHIFGCCPDSQPATVNIVDATKWHRAENVPLSARRVDVDVVVLFAGPVVVGDTCRPAPHLPNRPSPRRNPPPLLFAVVAFLPNSRCLSRLARCCCSPSSLDHQRHRTANSAVAQRWPAPDSIGAVCHRWSKRHPNRLHSLVVVVGSLASRSRTVSQTGSPIGKKKKLKKIEKVVI